LKKSISR